MSGLTRASDVGPLDENPARPSEQPELDVEAQFEDAPTEMTL